MTKNVYQDLFTCVESDSGGQTCCVTWHGGGSACLCFGCKEEVARRKKGGDVTGLLK